MTTTNERNIESSANVSKSLQVREISSYIAPISNEICQIIRYLLTACANRETFLNGMTRGGNKSLSKSMRASFTDVDMSDLIFLVSGRHFPENPEYANRNNFN